MNVSCPLCGGLVAMSAGQAGSVAACPHCGGDFQFPPIAQAIVAPRDDAAFAIRQYEQRQQAAERRKEFESGWIALTAIIISVGLVAVMFHGCESLLK